MKQKTGQPITIVMSRFNSYYIVQCIQQPQLWLQAHKSLHKSRMKHCKNIAGDPASCMIPYIIYSGIKIDLTAVTISYLFRPAMQDNQNLCYLLSCTHLFPENIEFDGQICFTEHYKLTGLCSVKLNLFIRLIKLYS